MHEPVFFEDLSVGSIFDSISKTITETEIIEFGWKYDPQPFHISKPDALASTFGGLIASAGSFKIGFKTRPSFGIGNKKLNGFEVKSKNKKKT